MRSFVLAILLSAGVVQVHFGFNLPSKDSTKKVRKKLFAVPTLGSAPETGFYAGGVFLVDFVRSIDSLARHSVVKTEVTYTAKRQFILNLDWTLSDSAQNHILVGDNAWMKFPELFWGIGGNTAKDGEVMYDAYRLELNNSYYRKIRPHMYVGVCQQFQSVYKSSFPDFNPQKTTVYSQIGTGISSGLGLGVLYDTRTHLLNPRPGERLVSVQSLGFGPWLGSDHPFLNFDADARYYQKTSRKSLLAFQAIAQLRSSGTPFRMLSLMGGPMMMRGHYQGRFRDNHQFAAQAEWRLQLLRWCGFTAFGSVGDVVSFKHPERNGGLKSAAGIGWRLLVDRAENTNMRFDFAMSNEGFFAFYIAFGEAF